MFLLGYWSKKLEHFSLITEKKVEVFHSILQEHSMEHDDGSSLFQTAKVIASCSFLSTFKACFFPFCQRDVSDINLRLVTGKTAGFLLGLFQGKASNSGRVKRVCFCHKQCKNNFP